MFFASNYFYAYQGAIVTAKFDGQTRALVATIEAVGAIVGALLIGYLVLDARHIKNRRYRGYLGIGIVAVMTAIVWAVGLSWQVTFNRADTSPATFINYKDKAFRGKAALFFFCKPLQIGFR